MITPRQIRAARALLGWSQQKLADKAIVSLNAVTRLERGEVGGVPNSAGSSAPSEA